MLNDLGVRKKRYPINLLIVFMLVKSGFLVGEKKLNTDLFITFFKKGSQMFVTF